MFGLQSWEWIIILVIVLLLFGSKRLPELARSLGAGIREFRKSMNDPGPETDTRDTGERKSSETH